MTALVASMVPDKITCCVEESLGRFVEMDALQAEASRTIAQATGAEAGCVSACVAAGICISLAAAMTGVNLAGRKTFRTPPRSARPRWSSSRGTSSATAQTSPGNPLSPPQTNTTNNKQTQVEVARPRRRNRTSFDTRSRKKPAPRSGWSVLVQR